MLRTMAATRVSASEATRFEVASLRPEPLERSLRYERREPELAGTVCSEMNRHTEPGDTVCLGISSST